MDSFCIGLPEIFEFAEWIVQVRGDALHSGVLQVVVAEVQLSQVGWVGSER